MAKKRINVSLDQEIIRTAKLIAIDMRTTVSGLFTACIQVCEKDYPKHVPLAKKIPANFEKESDAQ